MTDSVAAGLARERAHRQLLAQLARELCGWTWRQDWQAWCPPGWPERGDFQTSHLQRVQLLEQHGGVRTGTGIDQAGRPVLPEYVHAPEHTEILWRWIERHCPGCGHLRFERPPSRWRCVIAWGRAKEVPGTGETRAEALCRAALAGVLVSLAERLDP